MMPSTLTEDMIDDSLPRAMSSIPPFSFVLWAALGGALGASLRFSVGWLIAQQSWRSAVTMLLPTLLVNVIGCLCIGWILSSERALGEGSRVFVIVGVLGGFTTFSAFGWETLEVLRHHGPGAAVTNVVVQLILGLGAVVLGSRLP